MSSALNIVLSPDLSPSSSASLVETEETPENAEGMLMPLNQQMKEIFKWDTPLISCVAHI
jgi:hypothetical protein